MSCAIIKIKNMEQCATIIAAAILIVALVSFIIVKNAGIIMNGLVVGYNEYNRPANIDLTIIKSNDCKHCYDPEVLLNEIETENIVIRSKKTLDYRSSESRSLIFKYGIEKVPAILIEGEIGKNIKIMEKLKDMGEIIDEIIVFKSPAMPYVDVRSEKVVGSVKVMLMSASSCAECYNYEKYIAELKILGIPTFDREILDYGSAKGQSIVKEYSIERVPTFILTGDLDEYPALKKIQDFENDIFILRNVIDPYLDLKDMKVYVAD